MEKNHKTHRGFREFLLGLDKTQFLVNNGEMSSATQSVSEYLDSLPTEQKETLAKIRGVIKKNLPEGYEEVVSKSMISYQVPLSMYPDTFNQEPLMYAAISSQRNQMAVYMTALYVVPKFKDTLVAGYKKAGKKPDMGASCVRFKNIDDIPLETIGEHIAKISLKQFVSYAKKAHAKK